MVCTISVFMSVWLLFQKLSLQLIREKKLGELQTLLQPPEFSLLRPLLVLLGWELCNNLEEASQLLHTLWVDMVSVAQ